MFNGSQKTKSDFIQNELNENMNDSSKFWKHLKKVIPGKNPSENRFTVIDQTTNIEIKESETADFINDYFTNIGYNLSKDMTEPWSYSGTRAEVKLTNIEPTLEETIQFCKEINIHKASAITDLSSKLLKEAFIYQAEKMSYIYDPQPGNVLRLFL